MIAGLVAVALIALAAFCVGRLTAEGRVPDAVQAYLEQLRLDLRMQADRGSASPGTLRQWAHEIDTVLAVVNQTRSSTQPEEPVS